MIEPTQNDLYLLLRDDYIKLKYIKEQFNDTIYKNFSYKPKEYLDEDIIQYYDKAYFYSEWARIGPETGFRMLCGLVEFKNTSKVIFRFDYSSLELDDIMQYYNLNDDYEIFNMSNMFGKPQRIKLTCQEYTITSTKMPIYVIKRDWHNFVDDSKGYVYHILNAIKQHEIGINGKIKANDLIKRYGERLNRKYPYWYNLEHFKPWQK